MGRKQLGGSKTLGPMTIEDWQVTPIVNDDYSIGIYDYIIRVDSIAKVINLQLPDPSQKREFRVVNARYSNAEGSGSGYNLIPFGSEKIGDTTGTKYVSSSYPIVDFLSDGVNWHIAGLTNINF